MWFKNLKLYSLTDVIQLEEQTLQTQLEEFSFRPCGNQDLATMGWAAPIQQSNQLLHSANGNIWLCLKKQERLLPSTVVAAELAAKVEKIEAETGSPVPKKTQQDMKQEIIHQLLPQAFTKDSFTHGFVSVENNLVVVDAGSDGKAEAFLAMLRKAIGSLPVVPMARQSIEADMTLWLKQGPVPEGFALLEEAELKHPDEDGGTVRCKNQDLTADEISHHLEAGKLVQKLAIEWDETLTAIIQEDLTIKRLKFSDVLKEQNEDIPKDQQLARLDADFALMTGEVIRFAKALQQVFALDQE